MAIFHSAYMCIRAWKMINTGITEVNGHRDRRDRYSKLCVCQRDIYAQFPVKVGKIHECTYHGDNYKCYNPLAPLGVPGVSGKNSRVSSCFLRVHISWSNHRWENLKSILLSLRI